MPIDVTAQRKPEFDTTPPPHPFKQYRDLLDPILTALADLATWDGCWIYDWLRAYGALAAMYGQDEHLAKVIERWPAGTKRRAARALLRSPEEDTPLPVRRPMEYMAPLAQTTAEYINRVLVASRGSMTEAALTLGVARSTLYRWVDEMPQEWRSPAVAALLEKRRRGGDETEG